MTHKKNRVATEKINVPPGALYNASASNFGRPLQTMHMGRIPSKMEIKIPAYWSAAIKPLG
jgi:hypothetical protein